ncbi:hypothetical protein PICSAR103_03810 [Mycobacterium avium subsp. paratuberculosis]|nr:hypothetical protein PICSAR103_03810 [Mycobacterium avium subsp. paratuberculosis]
MVSRPTDDLARGSALAGYYASPDSTQARPTSNAAAAAALLVGLAWVLSGLA